MNCIDLTSKRSKMFYFTSQNIQNNSNLQKYSNYNELHRFDVKNIKQRKTTKVIKLRRSAWIWCQNEQKCFVTSETIQNNANLQKLSKYNEVHGFDVKTNKNVELRRKPFKTTQIYKNDQITMKCMDLTSKLIASIWCQNDKKFWVTSQTIWKTAKLQKWSNYDELHRFDVKTIKMLSYFPNHSKQLKPTKVFKLQWTASIWCQKHQTTQNYKSNQITMKCMDLASKRTKIVSYVANHSKQRKSKKVIKIQWIASIWCQNDKNVELRPKPFETQ